MNKLVCLVVCALVAGGIAQDAQSPANFDIVQTAATMCTQGCPVACQLMRTFCFPIPGALMACDAVTQVCNDVCTQTCGCITSCGPNCDTFEASCNNFNIPTGLQPFFCPSAGIACDAICVASCPQTVLMNLLQSFFSQTTASIQQYLGSLAGQGQAQAPVAAVNALN